MRTDQQLLSLPLTNLESISLLKLFIAPFDDVIDQYCFSTKGSGGDTFCTSVDCKTVSHKSIPKFKVTKGDIFIEKTSGAAFSRTFFNALSLYLFLLESWTTLVNTMQDWIDLFGLASAGLRKELPKRIEFKDLQEEHFDKVKIR